MSSPSKIVVSGMRPTGLLHMGHYFGVLKNWVELQKKNQCYFFVADWHALTTEYAQVKTITESLAPMVLDWLSAGVDPEKACLFVQSHVPEHAELHLLFSMIAPLGWLERVPSYKEMKQELKDKDLSTYGFLGYPLLQTADVAIYKATDVPVGQDQSAHLELSREIVRRFNYLYGETFPEPQTLFTPAPKVPGTDGRKMSKSYGNGLYLSEPTESFNKKIMQSMTDPARMRRTDPGNPDICPVFAYHQLVTPAEKIAEINVECRRAGIGCVDCKKTLIQHMDQELGPVREKRTQLMKKSSAIKDVLLDGMKKARVVAGKTLAEANQAMGLGAFGV